MAVVYKNITGGSPPTTTTLIAKSGGISGGINSITITNHDLTDSCRVTLYLDDGAGSPTIYTLLETTIPPLATLLLDDKGMIRFDSRAYSLKIDASTTADLTVIIS
tara:strand:- start:16 stop:333 length:318 start_codon:yes stop_codon:yes gene_type:complete